MKRSLFLAFFAFLPTPATAQPLALLPNELHWFTRSPQEPVDRKELNVLLGRDARKETREPWKDEILVVGWAGFGDADLKDVVRMTKLTHLWLRQSGVPENKGRFRISPTGWSRLRELRDLRVLGISDADLDDASLAEIGKLTNLTALYLDCKGSDGSVRKLADLKKLVHLWLNVRGARLTDDCARDIAAFAELKDLVVANSAITDAGVKELRTIPNLRSLEIGSSGLTDAAFKEVAAMKRMVAVALVSPRITQDGVDDLWQARPDLLMINGAGIPPGPESTWTIEQDFLNPGPGMFGAANEVELARLTDRAAGLRRLAIGWPGMTGAAMKDVAKIKRLTHLHVAQAIEVGPGGQKREVKIDAGGWKRLSELAKLRVLIVKDLPLDADSFAEIGKLTELRTLRLSGTNGIDDAVRKLAGLEKLTGLDLSGSRLTDAGLKDLMRCKNLRYLSLSETGVTDEGVKQLAALPLLSHLYLDGLKISDASARRLARIKSLRFVSLSGATLTDVGLRALNEHTMLSVRR
ncbi:MAG: hypothetical protein U0793_32890 [Gemmataceae bacterium]